MLIVVHGMYSARFEGAKSMIDSNRRIPLWFPYEISEQYGTNAAIGEWDYTIKKEPRVITGAVSRVDMALMRPDHIEAFTFNEGAICGIKELQDFPTGEALGTRYFLFSTNHVSVKYFLSENEYLDECARYGLNGAELCDFAENFYRFWSGRGKCSIKRVVQAFCRTGFDVGEISLLAILLFVWLRMLRRTLKCKIVSCLQSHDREMAKR